MTISARESEKGVSTDQVRLIQNIQQNIEKVLYGKREAIQLVLTGLLSRGHVLIEDVPGVGKTLLARALARSLDCSFQRIQFTADLLPSDIVGVSIYNTQVGKFQFRPGPIFANVVLADEINRSTPRTQSSLLEGMNDSQVSVDGVTHELPQPFIVLGTQNPHEFEGTYPLPESELDRFFLRVHIGYPGQADEKRMLQDYITPSSVEDLEPVVSGDAVIELQAAAASVRVAEEIYDYLMAIISATRECEDFEFGASPRAALALLRAAQSRALIVGRDYCIPDDVKLLVHPVLDHRMIRRGGSSASRDGAAPNALDEILNSVSVPL